MKEKNEHVLEGERLMALDKKLQEELAPVLRKMYEKHVSPKDGISPSTFSSAVANVMANELGMFNLLQVNDPDDTGPVICPPIHGEYRKRPYDHGADWD